MDLFPVHTWIDSKNVVNDMGLSAKVGLYDESLKCTCLIMSLGVLWKYSLQKKVLQCDAIKEHFLGLFYVFINLRQLFNGMHSVHC